MLKFCDRKFFKILNICNLHSVDVYSEAESCVLVRMASNSAIYLRLPNAGITGIGLLFCFIKLILKQINKSGGGGTHAFNPNSQNAEADRCL